MNAHQSISLFQLNRLVITGTLEVCSPLALGSGKRKPESDIKDTEANQLVEDHLGLPYIPGSSLKGIMKRLAGTQPGVDQLFGEPHENAGAIGMGSLMVYGAEFDAVTSPTASQIPYYSKQKGSGINARTAINAARGTAEKTKLFHERQVPPGAKFNLRLELMLTGNAQSEKLLGSVLGVMEQGFAMGRGSGSGHGRLKLVDVRMETHGIDPQTGAWGTVTASHQVQISSSALPAPSGRRIKLKLICDGPFLVNDPSWDKILKAKPKDARKKEPKLKALGMAESMRPEAILPGPSLKGVLRSRSAWIEACRDGNMANRLTTLLFGDTERAAVLRIERLTSTHQGEVKLDSVKLDRFSGAPIEKALFSCKCFVNPIFDVELYVDQTHVTHDNKPALDSHIDALLKSIEEDGLMVGMGGNRGFGWCRVEVVT